MLSLTALQSNTAYFDSQGRPTPEFQRLWQSLIEALLDAEARLTAGGL